MAYLFAVAALAVLIVVHEAGHMWVAWWSGMRVEKFSVFFGPAIWRRQGKRTTYQLGIVPLGGYVQVAGMNPHDDIDDDDPGSYRNKSVWKRFATIAAGPAVNYIFATIIMLAIAIAWGTPQTKLTVAEVSPKSPAQAAGLVAKDVILSIDDKPMNTTVDVQEAIAASKNQPLVFRLLRNQRERSVSITPKRMDGALRIGIMFGRTISFKKIILWRSNCHRIGLSCH